MDTEPTTKKTPTNSTQQHKKQVTFKLALHFFLSEAFQVSDRIQVS